LSRRQKKIVCVGIARDMMHYPLSADDATTELYQCGQCGAMGEADDCRVEAPAATQTDNQPKIGDTTVMERWDPASGTWYERKLVWDGKQYVPATPAVRKPATTEDDMERARRYGKGDQEVAA
jgi:hypothetical protein